jgi:hypothetical protein
MRAQRAAAQRAAEELSAHLAADDSKQRALKEMMNATLETRRKEMTTEDSLVSGRGCGGE